MAQTKAECKRFFIILYKFNVESERSLQRSAPRDGHPLRTVVACNSSYTRCVPILHLIFPPVQDVLYTYNSALCSALRM